MSENVGKLMISKTLERPVCCMNFEYSTIYDVFLTERRPIFSTVGTIFYVFCFSLSYFIFTKCGSDVADGIRRRHLVSCVMFSDQRRSRISSFRNSCLAHK